MLPLIGGTGQVTQGPPRGPRPAAVRAVPAAGGQRPLPSGMTAMPSAEAGPNGFPTDPVYWTGAARGVWVCRTRRCNGSSRRRRKAGRYFRRRRDVFQMEWMDACKGKSNNVVHGTSSKTHCDFDYSGTMIEQMLLGLVAHRAGKKLEYDGAQVA